jgi:hypothetical protein
LLRAAARANAERRFAVRTVVSQLVAMIESLRSGRETSPVPSEAGSSLTGSARGEPVPAVLTEVI